MTFQEGGSFGRIFNIKVLRIVERRGGDAQEMSNTHTYDIGGHWIN